ncbi:MAG: PEP-CTERM sorting domain-containing protein [Nostoc indistinguendum CM1-VF10]|jgi:hypothetical protein|nr:PEP-CTERM sorting domain-containing protein [Nostoc indistinguendum CM1-VF10]
MTQNLLVKVALVITSAAVVSVGANINPAAASNLITDNYERTGVGESIVVPFSTPSLSSVNTYAGLLEVLVSGTGFSAGSAINDAFYGVPSGVPYDSQYYQLNIGSQGQPLFPLAGESRNINNFITFIDGVGAVAPGTTPAYNPSHIYKFVVNLPSNFGLVSFGVSDGIFNDNGGQYNIEIHQLSPKSVPEPGTVAALALVGLGAFLSKKKLAASNF